MSGRPIIELPYLTAGQVARMLGVSRQTVHNRVRRGELIPSAVTPEGAYVFSRDYVAEVCGGLRSEATKPEEAVEAGSDVE